MMHGSPPRIRVIRIVNTSSDAPPRFVEYTYYASLFYALLAPSLGLLVPLLNIGITAVLAVYCVCRLGSRMRTVCAPMAFPLGCGISYIAVNLVFHDEPLMEGIGQSFIPWLLTLIIVQSLSLRQEFLHRFAFTAFIIGLATLPYLQFYGWGSDVVRMRLDKVIGGLANPNDLGAWFGFCCVYFAIAGLETKRHAVRVASWLAAGGCLYIVGLTVSRGALLASAIAIIVALRRLLKRGFVPVLILFILGWIIYISGLFERVTGFYLQRGTEETGRLLVWPLAIERFLSSPLIGVGSSDTGTYVPGRQHLILPHNSFITLALGSGVVPLIFFLGYWIRAVRGVFSTNVEHRPDAPFRIPLLIYTFLISFQHDSAFMTPWAIIALSVATGSPHRLRWVKRRNTAEHGECLDKARLAM